MEGNITVLHSENSSNYQIYTPRLRSDCGKLNSVFSRFYSIIIIEISSTMVKNVINIIYIKYILKTFKMEHTSSVHNNNDNNKLFY